MTKHTNKIQLQKSLQLFAITAMLMFLGPTLVYIGLSNKEKPLWIPILIFGSIACLLAVFFLFKAIKLAGKSIFD